MAAPEQAGSEEEEIVREASQWILDPWEVETEHVL